MQRWFHVHPVWFALSVSTLCALVEEQSSQQLTRSYACPGFQGAVVLCPTIVRYKSTGAFCNEVSLKYHCPIWKYLNTNQTHQHRRLRLVITKKVVMGGQVWLMHGWSLDGPSPEFDGRVRTHLLLSHQNLTSWYTKCSTWRNTSMGVVLGASTDGSCQI